MIEKSLQNLTKEIRLLRGTIRTLIEVQLSIVAEDPLLKDIPAVIKARNRKADKEGLPTEFGMKEAKEYFGRYYTTFGEADAVKLLKKYLITNVTQIQVQNINEFCADIYASLQELED